MTNSPTGTIIGTGRYIQADGQTINDGSFTQTTFEIFNGNLSGTGTFIGDVLIGSNATVNPGNSPGIMTIDGNFNSIGTLAIEIGGLVAGTEYDVLNVSGTATLAGMLDVSLFDLGGGLFTPSLGDSFDILVAETIVGEFDLFSMAILGTGLDWDVSYLLDNIGTDIVRLSVVDTSVVPVPPAVWLFGTALVGLIGFSKRRKAS